MNRGEFVNLVKRFEKSLFKAKSGLKGIQEAAAAFKDAADAASLIEQAIAETPSLAKDFQLMETEKKSVAAWRETASAADAVRLFLEQTAESRRTATQFFESFRNKRAYVFPNHKATLSFFEELTDLFSVSKFEFRPQFIGTIDLGSIARELRLPKGKQSIVVSASDLRRTVRYLLSKNISSNLVFDSPELRVFWQNPKLLRIDAPSRKLKLLDRICTTFQGSCTEKIV
jgi:hypothetical protein